MSTTVPKQVSDSWQRLADVAVSTGDAHSVDLDDIPAFHETHMPPPAIGRPTSPPSGLNAYRLVRDNVLTAETVLELVEDFRKNYHDYLPLVPKQYYSEKNLETFAAQNKHLLTAVLTIASKDLPGDRSYIHETCCRHMQALISSIAAGVDCGVEAVEALLLLAEWVPQGLRASGDAVGRGEEDRTAWMHVGMALRVGYYLSLDRTSFRSDDVEEPESLSRKRLAWACCYISDRLISCRIGKGFWSRGPGPMTGLSSNDFPSLQPVHLGDEDHARIFKATLDLTQIYGNVHDILYTATRANGQMILTGDYVKYIDEFRSTISRWHGQWGSLICSQHIKVTLDLSYHYLQLYTNAFAFQAAISQALSTSSRDSVDVRRKRLQKLFKETGGMQDARFIFKSVEAAKQYLVIFNAYVDAEKQLRYMPIRFYLYCIYSAVFLYKARSFGALAPVEEPRVWEVIYATIKQLKLASVSPNDTGSRYARLLELLWQKSRPSQAAEEAAASHRSRHDSHFTSSFRVKSSWHVRLQPSKWILLAGSWWNCRLCIHCRTVSKSSHHKRQ